MPQETPQRFECRQWVSSSREHGYGALGRRKISARGLAMQHVAIVVEEGNIEVGLARYRSRFGSRRSDEEGRVFFFFWLFNVVGSALEAGPKM